MSLALCNGQWKRGVLTTGEVPRYGIILSSSKESFGILLLFIENLKIWKHLLIYKVFNFLILCLGMSCQLLKPSLYLSIFMQMNNYFLHTHTHTHTHTHSEPCGMKDVSSSTMDRLPGSPRPPRHTVKAQSLNHCTSRESP